MTIMDTMDIARTGTTAGKFLLFAAALILLELMHVEVPVSSVMILPAHHAEQHPHAVYHMRTS